MPSLLTVVGQFVTFGFSKVKTVRITLNFLFADQCNLFRKIFINVGPTCHNSHVPEPNI